ncbi:MAG TPA: phospholipase D-like domain-containing protein, partial [Pyrinomonadaceae bacterium]|nr:phospholipase D-like domain-containing protein [Pyrinomonadaceae bacterium]
GVAGEKPIFDDLKKFGCEAVAAPSCASDAISFFPSSHEKVVVIDDTWTLVQSGNYSKNSIPLNEKDGGDPANFVTGNRDMGVAIRSKPLAKFFTKILRSDMKLETNAEGVEALHRAIRRKRAPDLVEAVPEALPPKLFPSKKFNPTSPIKVVPVLTPDNYMDVVPDFIKKAKKSILIEQQYIRGSHTRVITLLNAIRFAMDQNPNLDVRIILGKIFSQSDLQKEKANLDNIKKVFKLSLGTNIRFIDIKRFVHCHNKLVIVDNQAALVSSQNWSETGVGTNREAGLVIYYPDVARYFSNIFESDWSTALKTFPKIGGGSVGPESLARGNFMEVSAADYQEV